MSDHNDGFLAGCFITFISCLLAFGLIIWEVDQKCDVESNTPITPELQITVINGVPDTTYIYHSQK